MRKPTVLTREPKLFAKLCKKINNDFGCKLAFRCSVACPLFIAREVEWLMNYKGATLGEAYKMALRANIGDNNDKKAILREAIRKDKPDYPMKPFKEIKDDNIIYEHSGPAGEVLFKRRGHEGREDSRDFSGASGQKERSRLQHDKNGGTTKGSSG